MEAEKLKDVLSYSPETGMFTSKTHRGNRKAGSELNCPDGSGDYILIMLQGKRYRAHNLAWFYMYGVWPNGAIDHINHNGLDNRIANLREVTHQENCKNRSLSKNNKSGCTGVRWNNKNERWESNIRVNGEQLYLGSFEGIFEAACARKSANNKYGYHANHGERA